MASFDVFVSYAHADRQRVLELRAALEAHGLTVWLDDRGVRPFASITLAIGKGLARSKALLAYYSQTFPERRACQWELTAAFLAAQRSGRDPRDRVLILNSEPDAAHIDPIELRDALFATAPALGDGAALKAVAQLVAAHVAALDGALGELGVATLPRWVGRRPVGASRFVGRIRDMWAVHSALTAGTVGLISGAHAGDPLVKLTGMGGVGKSLLAHEYALRFGAAFPGGVFWLRAHGHDDRGDTLTPAARDADRNAQLFAFAEELEIDADELSPDRVSRALTCELDGRRENFLWVVDDFPSDIASDTLELWCAPGAFGRTLLTMRSREHASVGGQLDLGVLTSQEGLELLTHHRRPLGAAEWEAACGLVEDLGRHALALDVAGAAVRAEVGVRSYQEYRNAIAHTRDDELELAAGLVGELPGGHEASIVTTFARSILQLDEPGLDFLRLAAQLATEPIPTELVINVLAQTGRLDADVARQTAVAAMSDAVTRSLAEVTDDDSRQVHTLIARTVRHLEDCSARHARLADAAADVLTDRLAYLASDRVRVTADVALLIHGRHLATRGAHLDVALLRQVGLHDYYRGDFRSAQGIDELLLDHLVLELGGEHPTTLEAMNSLGETLRVLGDLANAHAMHASTLATRERVLGRDHRDTLTSIHNLAGILMEEGDLAEAAALLERALEGRRRTLGDTHPDTLFTANGVAAIRLRQGDVTSAHELAERTLAMRLTVLGDDHPETLQSMSNLAVTTWATGDRALARQLAERALDGRIRVLGEDHPDTIRSKDEVALILQALDDQ